MNLTKYTTIKSLVSKETYNKYGNNSLWFISDYQVRMVLAIESLFPGKKLFVNNWENGGNLHSCGTRFSWDNNYLETSQHAKKSAVDIHIIGIDPKEIYGEILKQWPKSDDKNLKTITTLEDITITKTWVHCDSRMVTYGQQQESLLIVKP